MCYTVVFNKERYMDKQEFIENLNKAGLNGEEVCRELEAEIAIQKAKSPSMEDLPELLVVYLEPSELIASAIVWHASPQGAAYWSRIYRALQKAGL